MSEKPIEKRGGRFGISLAFAALLFMLLSSIVFAQSDQAAFGFKTETDWIFIAYLVLMIVTAMLGIAFGVSRIFAMPQLEAWVKEEFVNLLISAVILVFFTTFMGVVESLSSSLASDILYSTFSDGTVQYWTYTGSTGRWATVQTADPQCPYPCHIYIARGFLGSLYEKYGPVISGISQLYFVSMLYQSATYGMKIDITAWITKSNFGFGWPGNADLLIYNNILSTVVSEYLKIITALKMQEVGLVYMTSLAGLLFIFGIIMRSVWFLRKFGGLLIAAGVGLYVIFPMMYILSWYSIDRSTVTFSEPNIDLPEISASSSDAIGSVVGSGFEPDIDGLFTSYDEKGRVSSLGILDALGRAYLSNIVIPIMSIFTTIGFIRHFSPMIGGDPEIAGLTRII